MLTFKFLSRNNSSSRARSSIFDANGDSFPQKINDICDEFPAGDMTANDLDTIHESQTLAVHVGHRTTESCVEVSMIIYIILC